MSQPSSDSQPYASEAPPYLTSSAWISRHANSLGANQARLFTALVHAGFIASYTRLASCPGHVEGFSFQVCLSRTSSSPTFLKEAFLAHLATDAQSKLTIWTHYSMVCVDINHV